MRSHRLLALSLCMMACSANAADRAWTLPGAAFRISAPCAALVTITPARAASNSVSVAAHAAHLEELARLVFEPADAGTSLHPVVPGSSCWQPAAALSWTPTLTVVVEVPPGAALSIDDAGQAAYRIGAVGGSLAVDLTGHSTLEDASATATSLDLSGATRLTLHHVAGRVTVDAAGDSGVMVDEIEAPTLSLDLSGLYHVAIGTGAIGALSVDASGAGDVAIGGTTGSAKVSLSGDAHVRIATLTGPIERDVSGVATVETGP